VNKVAPRDRNIALVFQDNFGDSNGRAQSDDHLVFSKIAPYSKIAIIPLFPLKFSPTQSGVQADQKKSILAAIHLKLEETNDALF